MKLWRNPGDFTPCWRTCGWMGMGDPEVTGTWLEKRGTGSKGGGGGGVGNHCWKPLNLTWTFG